MRRITTIWRYGDLDPRLAGLAAPLIAATEPAAVREPADRVLHHSALRQDHANAQALRLEALIAKLHGGKVGQVTEGDPAATRLRRVLHDGDTTAGVGLISGSAATGVVLVGPQEGNLRKMVRDSLQQHGHRRPILEVRCMADSPHSMDRPTVPALSSACAAGYMGHMGHMGLGRRYSICVSVPCQCRICTPLTASPPSTITA